MTTIKKDFNGNDVIQDGRGGIRFVDLTQGDILKARNGDLYFVTGTHGNAIIRMKDGVFGTLNNDLTNPKSNSSGGKDIIEVLRWDAIPDLQALSETIKLMLQSSGVRNIVLDNTKLRVLWQDETPQQAKARIEAEQAKKALRDAQERVDRAQRTLNSLTR